MPSIPWPWRSEPLSTPKEAPKPINDPIHEIPRQIEAQLDAVPPTVLAFAAFGLGAVTASTTALLYARYGRRIRNSDWVSPDVFARRRWIKGVVTAVGDADNFRLYHTPQLGFHWPLMYRRVPSATKELKDETLHIRIAGVDAPEAAHFGRPAQPYSAESLAWLRGIIQGKIVYCQILRRDQYSRIVANVTLSPRILPGAFVSGKNLSLEMLRAGWGTTYEQAGAEYGKAGKAEFLRVEAEAKAARRGMWAKGVNMESPAEYKRRHAAAGSPEEAARSRGPRVRPNPQSWLKRMLNG